MANCELLEKCPFFDDHMQDMPRHAELFKELYCRGGKTICARYIVFRALGHEAVPQNLFPNQVAVAEHVIDQAKVRKV